MPKIVVKRKTETYKEFLLRPNQLRIKVGSEGDNDLIIADKNVSLYHLNVLKEGNQYFIEDLNSEAGTFLNGKKIEQRANLNDGDIISIGEHSLIFENALYEENGQTENQPGSRKEPTEPQTEKDAESGNLESEKNSSSSAIEKNSAEKEIEKNKVEDFEVSIQKSEKFVPHSLLAIHGPYLGKKYNLKADITKIGRDQTLNDIIICETAEGEIDSSISRRHATIYFEDGNFFIRDKRSKTRTRVNQKQLDEDDMIQLSPGDEIQIVSDRDSTIFRFLESGKDDFSRPHKAGFWWDRNAFRLGKIVSFFLAAVLIILLTISYNNIKLIRQKPGILKFEERVLFTSENDQIIFLNQQEVLKNAAALAPAVADLNGDHFLDIVFLDKIGYLQVVDGKTYLPLWKENFPHRTQLPVGITLADMNDNDLPDIILAAHNSIIYVIDGNSGNEIWASPMLGGSFSGNPVVADLNGDKLFDVFICDQSGRLHIGFGGISNPEWTTLQVETKIACPPSAADFNNDGLPEVVFGSDQGQIFVHSGDQRKITNVINVNEELQKAKGTLFENHVIKQRIAAAKLNNDPYNDILILTDKNHLLAYDVFNNKRIWFDILKTDSDSGTALPATIGDLNGDKKMEVAVVTKDNKIVTYDGFGKGTGLKKINWGYVPRNNEQFVSLPVIADINKDQKNDILMANYNGGIEIFDGTNGKLLNEFAAANSDSFTVIGTPVVADLNNNGWLDILLRKNDNSFTLLESNNMVKQGSIIWGQFNYNALQNGCRLSFNNYKLLYFSIFVFSILLLILLVIVNLQASLRRKRLIKQRV